MSKQSRGVIWQADTDQILHRDVINLLFSALGACQRYYQLSFVSAVRYDIAISYHLQEIQNLAAEKEDKFQRGTAVQANEVITISKKMKNCAVRLIFTTIRDDEWYDGEIRKFRSMNTSDYDHHGPRLSAE